MKDLPYLGLFIKGESPRGYLLRTAFYNGYTTIGELAVRLGANTNPAYQNTLLGKSDIVEKLVAIHDKTSDNIMDAFYKQIKGVTKTSDIIIHENRVPFKLLRSKCHHICWQCLKDNNHISAAFDISVVDVCIKHKTYLQYSCTTCSRPFNWRNTGHKSCNCPVTENDAPLVLNCDGAERVALAINKSETHYLGKLLGVLKALRHHRSADKIERNNLLNQAVRMLDGESDVFTNYLLDEQKKYPGIPVRVLISPLIALGYEDIEKKVSDSLLQFSEDYPSKCKNCECKSKYLTTTEAMICLEISSGTLNKLCQNQLIHASSTDTRKSKVFPYENMCQFFRKFIPTSEAIKETDKLQPISYTAPGNSLIEKLKDVQSGKISTVKVNQAKGLTGIFLIEIPSISNLKMDRPDLMTSSQAAMYLNVYPDAIRSISKTEFLEPYLTVATQPFFHTQDIEIFDKKYVFAASLARKYQIDPRDIVNRLRAKKINEVSGPKIDGTLTPLYVRDEVERNDLFSIRYSDYRERYSHNTKYSRSNTPQHLTAKAIAKLLGIAVNKIIKIEKYGLLNQIPLDDINDKRRVYSQDSYDKTLQWFSKAKELGDLATELGINKWHLTRLFITTKYVQPLTLSIDNQLLSLDDQKKINDHVSIFCTCSEADKFRSAPDKHFHNLVKSNRFPIVSKKDYLCDTEMILLYWNDVKNYKF
ncbi:MULTISPECIES: TniQ family protein [unclassified Methylophaga]|jgi:hypothetical protein|uniref:TniQ family protein n=1 Tax=unclassified Methylophaga TaxID=2629249 RepID=UPI000C99235B|nr:MULTISPECIES: TniQ family protein [unclassified Methylophaga]MAK65605.1 hypothetical protein [Methylophaga sp.]MAY16328.1 hypothetical protein [Methylophaga sp.]HCD06597.1 hypothetical protein [Methylophaga sp.]|tara:strand:+ start:5228 stop:7333 length:2106 start_codon:yes stop_codon:yes gene_type:complete